MNNAAEGLEKKMSGAAKGAAFNKAVDATAVFYGNGDTKEDFVKLVKWFFEEFKEINCDDVPEPKDYPKAPKTEPVEFKGKKVEGNIEDLKIKDES